MQVGMGLAVMGMVMGVDVEAGGLPKPPDPDPDQHRPHQMLTPSRDRLHGQRLSESEGCQAHEGHTCGMPQAPTQPNPPRSGMGAGHQRRHRRQMVRSRPDVEKPRAQAENRNQHGPRMEGEVTRGNRRLDPPRADLRHRDSGIPSHQDLHHLKPTIEEVPCHPYRRGVLITDFPDSPITQLVDHGVGIGEEDRGMGCDEEL